MENTSFDAVELLSVLCDAMHPRAQEKGLDLVSEGVDHLRWNPILRANRYSESSYQWTIPNSDAVYQAANAARVETFDKSQ